MAIDKATGGHPLGYIVDLRSNPGGLLDQAVDVADDFLDSGEIVSQRGRTKDDIERYYARPGDLAHGLPVIVLTDAGTASASEIVAGALQDHRRALDHGREELRQGLGADRRPDRSRERAAADDGALLHAVGPLGSGGRNRAGRRRPAAHRPRLQGSRASFAKRIFAVTCSRRPRSTTSCSKADDSPDPRFTAKAEELEKKGIKDFQLYYAMNTLKRLGSAGRGRVGDAGQEGALGRHERGGRDQPATLRRPVRTAAIARLIALLLPVALLGGALGSQYLGGLHPCEMCYWQRWPHGVAIVLALLAFTAPAPVAQCRAC